jgi:hypothetical protein
MVGTAGGGVKRKASLSLDFLEEIGREGLGDDEHKEGNGLFDETSDDWKEATSSRQSEATPTSPAENFDRPKKIAPFVIEDNVATPGLGVGFLDEFVWTKSVQGLCLPNFKRGQHFIVASVWKRR